MKKYAAGKVIGLQNLLPQFAEKTEVVHFTANMMVAELHEIDVELLRKVLFTDRDALEALW